MVVEKVYLGGYLPSEMTHPQIFGMIHPHVRCFLSKLLDGFHPIGQIFKDVC